MITTGSLVKIDQHDNFTRTVSCHYCDCGQHRKIRAALRTNHIAELVTMPSGEKIKNTYMYYLVILPSNTTVSLETYPRYKISFPLQQILTFCCGTILTSLVLKMARKHLVWW